jgi:hypothetical protein
VEPVGTVTTLGGVMDSKVTGIKSHLEPPSLPQNWLYLSRWLQRTTSITFTEAERGPPRRILPVLSYGTALGEMHSSVTPP